MHLLQKLKKIHLSNRSIVVIIGGIFALSIALTNIFVLHDNAKSTPTQNQPTATPTLTEAPTPTLQPTVLTPTLTQKKTVTPTVIPSPTQTPTPTQPQGATETLKIDSAEPNFLWADYSSLGYQYIHIKGNGFTSQTQFSLVATSGPDTGKIYYVGNVSLPSSHEFYGTLPNGLYNSYYKLQAYRSSDGARAETGAFLVVSGNTQAEGTAPPPDYAN